MVETSALDAGHSGNDSLGKAGHSLSIEVPFFNHDLGKPELDAIAQVLSTPILTTGEEVARFEAVFSDYLNRRHTVGLTSCTGALHLALLASGIGAGDEVITTPATFVATATAIIQAGARPVFVDVEPGTGNIDANQVEAAITSRTRAILPVHLYGLMADMRALKAIADRRGLVLIEDAAHCIEGQRDGVRPGQLSSAACFSFFATKNITCGEGGALVTDDELIKSKVRGLRLHGVDKTSIDRYEDGYQHWDMPSFGWKYNMDNLQAAMLLPQMPRLELNWKRRERLALLYRERLDGIHGISFPETPSGARHAHHLFTVRVPSKLRDDVIQRLRESKISAMVNYRAIHLLSYFRETYRFERGMFPHAEKLGEETISLPFYPTMPESHVEIVASRLRAILDRC